MKSKNGSLCLAGIEIFLAVQATYFLLSSWVALQYPAAFMEKDPRSRWKYSLQIAGCFAKWNKSPWPIKILKMVPLSSIFTGCNYINGSFSTYGPSLKMKFNTDNPCEQHVISDFLDNLKSSTTYKTKLEKLVLFRDAREIMYFFPK